VVETATEIVVTVELAGVDHEDLDVLLFEDALIVDGERRLPPAHAAGVFHVAEIQQGQFHLEIPLPATIDPDQVDARYERGLLEMRFVKQATKGTGATSIPIAQVVDVAASQATSDRPQQANPRTRQAVPRTRQAAQRTQHAQQREDDGS
jgi:hypothetical protein